jgi:hypothetical protein
MPANGRAAHRFPGFRSSDIIQAIVAAGAGGRW